MDVLCFASCDAAQPDQPNSENVTIDTTLHHRIALYHAITRPHVWT